MQNQETKLILYAVQNHEGKYFRAKGMNGYGDSWVDELKTAKIYPRIGPARSCVTFWNNLNIEQNKNKADHNKVIYPAPVIVELHVTTTVILDEQDRLNKAKIRKQKEQILKEKRELEWKIRDINKEIAKNNQSKLLLELQQTQEKLFELNRTIPIKK
jgi:hypothetical protein